VLLAVASQNSPNLNSVLIVLVGAISGCLGPLLLAWLLGRQRRRERAEDYARQDEVAAKVSEVADATKATAVAAEASNVLAVKTAEITNGKLDVIHVLVNSQMTAALQSELDATIRELAMMREVVALHVAADQDPTVGALAAIDATEAKIVELRSVLADRLATSAVVDEKVATVKAEEKEI
jgi:hypothetical protein